jgi:HlyD family secretion protein
MSDNKKDNNIELRSEDFNDVLGNVPPWILRWGITAIAIVIVILLIGSSVFKYPDTISSSVSLTGTAPVVSIVAKTSGKLHKLYVIDNQEVKQGEYLAVIENPANTEDILKLKDYLGKQENFSSLKLVLPNKMQLGNLQSLYASFYLSLSEYKQFLDLGYHQKKISYVEERIKQNEKYYKNMLRQQKLIEEQHHISETQYKRDSSLTKQGAFSRKELENSYNSYLQSQLSVENMNTSIDNLETQITQLQESLFDTQFQYIDKKYTLENQLRTQISQLLAEIELWEMTYILSSPISGEITFTEFWVENQNISVGDITFNIVPAEKGELVGKALLPTERSGKVAVGQKVNIKFANFPENEYGIVRGYVKNISLVPSKEREVKQYVVEIGLPDGLLTTYKKELPFLPEMEGQADIITDDITLLERFLLPLKKVLTESL